MNDRAHSDDASAPLAFTWLRVNGDHSDGPVSAGMYVHALEVALYLRQHGAERVAAALEDLAADIPPPTSSGWVLGR